MQPSDATSRLRCQSASLPRVWASPTRRDAVEVTAKEVASWARKAREATARRDAEIRRMRAEGASLRAIAEAAGLTHTAIAKIIAR